MMVSYQNIPLIVSLVVVQLSLSFDFLVSRGQRRILNLEVDFVENSKRLKENAQSIVAHYEIWHLPQIMDNGLG